MNNRLETKIKNAFLKDLNGMELPPADFIKQARLLVEKRKTQVKTEKSSLGFFNFRVNAFQMGFAACVIAGLLVFISQQKYSGGGLYDLRTQTATTSINSSTVLSGLTQHTNTSQSVNSSTVLTSIITFVAKN